MADDQRQRQPKTGGKRRVPMVWETELIARVDEAWRRAGYPNRTMWVIAAIQEKLAREEGDM